MSPSGQKFLCDTCNYAAASRRVLARHVAIAHSAKVFNCPLCPFVSRYQANLYRHKRVIHGIRRTSTCELCGYIAPNEASLCYHKESFHQHVLEKQKRRYENEKKRLLEDDDQINKNFLMNSLSANEKSQSDHPVNFSIFDSSHSGCVVNPSNMAAGIERFDSSLELLEEASFFDTVPAASAASNSGSSELGPVRIRRKYTCELCNLVTINPREFLYHRQQVHRERIAVFECPYCLYASKHFQKLQRHCGMVHQKVLKPVGGSKLKDLEKSAIQQKIQKQQAESLHKEEKASNQLSLPVGGSTLKNLEKSVIQQKIQKEQSEILQTEEEASNQLVCLNQSLVEGEENKGVSEDSRAQIENTASKDVKGGYQCSKCHFQAKSKIILIQHEKISHLKRKFFRCLQCDYVTHEKARYTKHCKYHSLPKVKCDFCNFSTAYKWNLDRHVRNHRLSGMFKCGKCSYTCHSAHALKTHTFQHHDPTLDEQKVENEIRSFNTGTTNEEEKSKLSVDEQPPGNLEEVNNAQGLEQNIQTIVTQNKQFDSSNSNFAVKQGKVYKKNYKCSYCTYRAAWPSDLKKHESSHSSKKLHSCPICGMGFALLPLLARHLRLLHEDSEQARNIACVIEMLSSGKIKKRMPILKTLLSECLREGSQSGGKIQSASASSAPSSTPSFNSIQVQMPHMSASLQSVKSDKPLPVCVVCGYKTRWISELEKHMRVHSGEKPFKCTHCNYKCKWRGDLTRHIQKYHPEKPMTLLVSKKPVLKMKIKNPKSSLPIISSYITSENVTHSETIKNSDQSETLLSIAKAVCHSQSKDLKNSQIEISENQETPLDLSLNNKKFNLENQEEIGQEKSHSKDMKMSSDTEVDVETAGNKKNEKQMEQENIYNFPMVETKIVKKYQCAYCPFITQTASRFHVHIVQHFNRKPFMCSACCYKSNWQWDITKHIKMKMARDVSHQGATCLLTDETGRRNYDKYKDFLIDVPVEIKSSKYKVAVNPGNTESLETSDFYKNSDQCSAELKGDMVNIVVTPDIPFPVEDSNEERAQVESSVVENTVQKEAKFFYCNHCNFHHLAKKVVVSHMAVHAGLKPFRCRICGLVSNWRHVILRHIKGRHGGHLDDLEERITVSQHGRKLYLSGVHSEDRKFSFPRESTSTSESLSCQLCPYTCVKDSHMKLHMKQHQPREGAVFKCLHCPYYVKFRKPLRRHMKLHAQALENNQNPLPNNILGDDNIQFTYPKIEAEANQAIVDVTKVGSSRKPATYVYTGLAATFKKYSCDGCPYKTDNRSQFLYHKQFHRSNSMAPYRCTVCSYWATRQHLIIQHMKVHKESNSSEAPQEELPQMDRTAQVTQLTLDKPEGGKYKCRFCPMKNKRRANVLNHEAMHGKDSSSKFACPLCNYHCNNLGVLSGHLKLHQESEVDQFLTSASEGVQKWNRENKSLLQQYTATDSSLANDSNLIGVSSPKESLPVVRKKVFSYFCTKCPAVFKSTADFTIHKGFHGSNYPFSCPHCDYRAKHKPHLHKHFFVHTPAYAAKREASYGPPVEKFRETNLAQEQELVSSTSFIDESSKANNENTLKQNPKSTAQCLQLEEIETRYFCEKHDIQYPQKLHECLLCPAVFYKQSTLQFHLQLHNGTGHFACSSCTYAVDNADNLSTHVRLHFKGDVVCKEKVRNKTQTGHSCPKCPAVFTKIARYERHINLHGQSNRYKCDKCDYSVKFAANLQKHKPVHERDHTQIYTKNVTFDIQPSSSLFNSETSPKTDYTKSHVNETVEEKEKRFFHCDRCPYVNQRKDAVQSHQKRHGATGGISCPYCDYTTMQPSCLRDHIRCHLQPLAFLKAQSFLKVDSMEIWHTENETKDLIFRDRGQSFVDRFSSPFEEHLLENFPDSTIVEAVNSNLCLNESEKLNIELDKVDGKVGSNGPSVVENETVESVIKVNLPRENDDSNNSVITVHVANEIENNVVEEVLSQHKTLEVVLTDVLENVSENQPEQKRKDFLKEVNDKDSKYDKQHTTMDLGLEETHKHCESEYKDGNKKEHGVNLGPEKICNQPHVEHTKHIKQEHTVDIQLVKTPKQHESEFTKNYKQETFLRSEETNNQPKSNHTENDRQENNIDLQVGEAENKTGSDFTDNYKQEHDMNLQTGKTAKEPELDHVMNRKQEHNMNLKMGEICKESESDYAEHTKQEHDMNLQSIETEQLGKHYAKNDKQKHDMGMNSEDAEKICKFTFTDNCKEEFNTKLGLEETMHQPESKIKDNVLHIVCPETEKLSETLLNISELSYNVNSELPSTSFQTEMSEDALEPQKCGKYFYNDIVSKQNNLEYNDEDSLDGLILTIEEDIKVIKYKEFNKQKVKTLDFNHTDGEFSNGHSNVKTLKANFLEPLEQSAWNMENVDEIKARNQSLSESSLTIEENDVIVNNIVGNIIDEVVGNSCEMTEVVTLESAREDLEDIEMETMDPVTAVIPSSLDVTSEFLELESCIIHPNAANITTSIVKCLEHSGSSLTSTLDTGDTCKEKNNIPSIDNPFSINNRNTEISS
ncbi:uncharacterized protein LOC106478894 [Limulus polyphemus]|uniref:Uncharacterized protein LOC106478894 n=1 Tax=Limulus polyphemus TaxID=6850 RepID=A0ABM1C661_LIMPO|nr:uncharacterized protein LOC106478894 [Limulus polyphemus]